MPAEYHGPDNGGESSRRRPVPRWEEDFPIQTERDHYVTRREFAKFLTLGSALLTLANAAIAFVGLRPKKDRPPVSLIALASTIQPGGSWLFRYPTDEDPCILIRTAAGEFLAYSQVCTHLSCAVVHDPAHSQLVCPCHRGSFSETEGRPVAGPPTRSLPRIKIEQRGGGLYAVGIEV
jgi:nitrite reductase/ring-hydroxylating ferredoxin subunit